MRMTNKIMRNNSAYNINQNKILQDKLTNQMTTQSKIVRPSDDPVVAIRALRLRSNVSVVTQYNEKNAKDAEQWLDLTAGAMKTVDEVLTDLYRQSEDSANKFKTSDDLRIHLSQMKEMTAEFYSCANVDYAGRYVFSGYRTDLPVTFTKEDEKDLKEHPVSYNIYENFGFGDISRISYTNYDKVKENLTRKPSYPAGVNETNSYEQTVTNDTLYRFRISYNNLDSLGTEDAQGKSAGTELNFTLPDGTQLRAKAATNADGTVQKDADGNPVIGLEMYDKTATPPAWKAFDNTVTGSFEMKEFADQEKAYEAVANGFNGIAFVPGSGELVFSKDFYEDKFSEAAFNGTDSFQINYNKSSWQNGDINPVHYFKCIETKVMSAPGVESADVRKTAYNTQRDQGRDQDIYYDVGYNQQIQVNTRADEIFTHNVQRDMDDFDHYLKQWQAIEQVQKDLEQKLKDWPVDSPEYRDLSERIEGVKKADVYIRENIHNKFENQITKYQQYMDDSRVAMTDNATRMSRLELVKTRLTDQQATFKELQQDNEGIDVTEVAVELSSSELTYSAALMATGKILQTNLMNYI